MKTHIILALLLSCRLPAVTPHPSSYPYISGDTFREHCTWKFDIGTKFDPAQVKEGDIIFVSPSGGMLAHFFSKYFPHIKVPHIIVTHNTDAAMPGRFAHYLDDPHIIAWFGQNWDGYQHSKIHPIPIGIANAVNKTGNIKQLGQAIKKAPRTYKKSPAYMNFAVLTNPIERQAAYDILHSKPCCFCATSKKYFYYLDEVIHYRFVISPHGAGLDCFRTWEALLLGCIPVVKKSSLDILYQDLPVIIVNDWHQVTAEFLDEQYEFLKSQVFDTKKLYFDYWWQKIKETQTQYLAKKE